MKKCTKCKIEQAKENFHKDKNRPDGLYCYCRECNSMKGKLHGAIFISHINKIITNNKEALFLP